MSDENSKIFTINSGNNGSEMPTLTSILYKRKSVKSDSSDKKAPKKAELTTIGIQTDKNAILGIDMSPPKTPGSDIPDFSDTKIQPSPWMPESTGEIEFIKTEALPNSTEPVLNLVHQVSQTVKFHGALIFEPDPNRKGRYSSRRCVNLKPKEELFRGMRMDPTHFPDLFARLNSRGFAELPPTPTQNLANAVRSGFRNAFGVEGGQWLSLVRFGEANQPQGIVAFFSDESLMGIMPKLKLTSAA
jgi:hypothetical protein